MKDNEEELLPIVDEAGREIAIAPRGVCHGGSMLLHPVVHLHVFNRDGELFLQKRPLWKDIQPGRWDTAVGGHVSPGESIEDSLRREAAEELGLVDFQPEKLTSYLFESERERELVNVFKTVIEYLPTPTEELDGGAFWTREKILQSIGREVFTPNFEQEYLRLFGGEELIR